MTAAARHRHPLQGPAPGGSARAVRARRARRSRRPAATAAIAAASPGSPTSRSPTFRRRRSRARSAPAPSMLGITGRDQVEETVADWRREGRARRCRSASANATSWSRCREPWIDVDDMADLDDVAADFRAAPRPPADGRDQIRQPHARASSPATASPTTASSKASARPKARRPPAPPTSSSTSPRPARRSAPTG